MRPAPAVRRTLALALAVAALALLANCRRVRGPEGPDLSTPEAACRVAMKALAAGDLSRLDVVLSPAGAAQVRRDLEAFRRVLSDPATGPKAMSRVAAPKDEAEKAAIEKALSGDPAALLALYVRADPHPDAAVPPPPLAPDASWAQMDYVARDGTRKRVVLTRTGGAWKVDLLQL